MRISGINVPDEKRVLIALTYVYGIGPTTAARALVETKIDAKKRTKDLNEKEQSSLQDWIVANVKTEGDLRREVQIAIKHHEETGTWRGLRHKKHLPVRGQSTRRNARTRKGKRVTVSSGRVKEQKT